MASLTKEEKMRRNGEFHFMRELGVCWLLGAATLVGFFPAIVEAEDLPRETVLPLSLATKAASGSGWSRSRRRTGRTSRRRLCSGRLGQHRRGAEIPGTEIDTRGNARRDHGRSSLWL